MTSASVIPKRKQVKSARNTSKSTEAWVERRRLAASIRGKYAWIPYSSEAFKDDKLREIALENRA